MSSIITVSGFIGAGKTTFINSYAQYLKDVYHVTVCKYLEHVEGNDLLNLMYAKPDRWMFTSQVNFLVEKVNSLRAALNNTESIVLVERDYLELLIFIEAQFTSGNIDRNEYLVYKSLYELFKDSLPKVYNYHIDVDYDICIGQIYRRGRDCEKLIDETYYRVLFNKYQKFYQDHPSDLIIRDNLSMQVYDQITERVFKELEVV